MRVQAALTDEDREKSGVAADHKDEMKAAEALKVKNTNEVSRQKLDWKRRSA